MKVWWRWRKGVLASPPIFFEHQNKHLLLLSSGSINHLLGSWKLKVKASTPSMWTGEAGPFLLKTWQGGERGTARLARKAQWSVRF
jgi:hypothetical protein